MHSSLKATASLVLVALLAGPALAATNVNATLVNALKADAMPVGSVTRMIGEWSAGDFSFLDKAASIKVFDTKALYVGRDLQQIASAETTEAVELTHFRDAIKADAGLAAWFKTNKLDIDRVVAVSDPSGKPEIFLY